MDLQYRVYDDRNKDETLFVGTHDEAVAFINKNYIAYAFEHIWLEEVK